MKPSYLQKGKGGQSGKIKIIPLGFVLKYDPPIIGLLYKRTLQDPKKKVYQIHLKNLIFHDDEVEITKMLFMEHPKYLDPDIIEPEQVLSLVVKLLEYKEERMHEMAGFLDDQEQNDESSNAFIYDKDPATDQDETESQYLEEDEDEEEYQALQEMERLKEIERQKLITKNNSKLKASKR